MKSTGVMVASIIMAGVLVAAYAAGFGGSIQEQERRKDCMSALSTPGVEDPLYDEKAVEFAQGVEECMSKD